MDDTKFDYLLSKLHAPPWHPEEMRKAWHKVRSLRPKNFLEIGSRNGDSFWLLSQALPKHSTCVAVDMPNGPWGRANTEVKLKERVDEVRTFGYDSHVVLGNSQSRDTDLKVRELIMLPEFTFIDGDHTYEGVKADWLKYGRYSKWVMFHDTRQPDKVPGPGRLVAELENAGVFSWCETYDFGWGTTLAELKTKEQHYSD